MHESHSIIDCFSFTIIHFNFSIHQTFSLKFLFILKALDFLIQAYLIGNMGVGLPAYNMKII